MGILEFSRESERMAEIGILKIHIENNEIEDSPLHLEKNAANKLLIKLT